MHLDESGLHLYTPAQAVARAQDLVRHYITEGRDLSGELISERREEAASEVLLDASALLALLNREPGHEEVAESIPDAAIGAVNLSEVAKLAEYGMPDAEIRQALEGLALEIHDFDQELAFEQRYFVL